MVNKLRVMMLALLTTASALVFAADAESQLRAFVSSVSSAQGEFKQVLIDEEGQQTDKVQSGQFLFERPGRFRWEVEKPYEQLTLSDGEELYQYDPDLAQVTIRAATDVIGSSPAAILFGSGDLDEAFSLESLSDKDGLQWLRATPKASDAGFTHVDLGFKNNQPEQIKLQDSFGQITHITLSGMQANPSWKGDEFRFEAPDDVDVVRM